MKIVIDGRIMFTSTGRCVERLVHHLQDLDDGNNYIVLLRREDMEKWQPRAANFSKLEADFAPYSLGEQMGFAGLLYGLEADLVHFTMPQRPVLYLRPHVVTIHDLTLIDYINKRREGTLKDFYKHLIKPAVFRVVVWWDTRLAKHLITPTDFVRNQLIERFGASPKKVTFTSEAADPLSSEEEELPRLKDKNFLLYVGNAYPYKNLENLIEAFKLLGRDDLSLVLAGKADYFYRQLQEMAKSQGIKNMVFTGFVSDAQLVWLYKNAQAYVFPSLSEGFGLPGLEAMQYDLPVVSSNASCLPEVYGEAAHYFDAKDPADMAAKIAEVMDDAKLKNQLIEAGKKRLKGFSWRRMAEQTLEAYRQAVK